MIKNCRSWLTGGDHHETLWEREPEVIIPMLQYCLKLNDAYHEQYHVTRERLMAISKGKQLEVSDQDIFSRMDLFCRRIQKLISMVGVHWPIPDEGMSATLSPRRASDLMCKCCSRGILPASVKLLRVLGSVP